MKHILLIHRYYKNRGGEDVFFDDILQPELKLAKNTQVDVLAFSPLRHFLEIIFMILGMEKLRPSYLKVKQTLKNKKYDAVFLNNFIPSLSLEIPQLIHQSGSKVFAWTHNSRLICANGLCFDGKKDCDDCLTKSSVSAVIKNCHRNIFQSAVYGHIYRGQRITRYLAQTPIHFLPISNFAGTFIKKALAFLPAQHQITVIPIPATQTASSAVEVASNAAIPAVVLSFIKNFNNQFYLYAGRLSFEKGVDRIIDLAKTLPQKAFVICGQGPLEAALKAGIKKLSLKNVLITNITKPELQRLYKNAEVILIPSRVKETFSLVIAESQPYGTPVAYPQGGGAEEAMKLLERTGVPFDEFKGQTLIMSQNLSNPVIDFTKSIQQLFQQ